MVNSGEEHERIKPLRIHGTHDHVIPMPASVDLALEGGHLIAMTHADKCVQFIKSALFHIENKPAVGSFPPS